MCKELPRDSRGAGKPAANENLESMVIPTEFLIANPFPLRLTRLYKETCFENTSRNSQNFLNNNN